MTEPATKADSELQARIDALLLEQGAFSPLELLFDSGRLGYEDYESWRRREVASLDELLMGDPVNIRTELQQAAGYARSIGLLEQPQEFYAWQQTAAQDRPLEISADRELRRLIGSRYIPAQSKPQLDLFFDNPVVALTNGIARALSARNAIEAQRQLDRLYQQAPTHPDLAAYDQLLAALGHLGRTDLDPQQELAFLHALAPVAKRLLTSQARDLLAPLWRQLAGLLDGQAFSPDTPELHRGFALSQAQDWAGVSKAVLGEPQWWQHAALCQLLAQSGFHKHERGSSLSGWFQLCWRHPEPASAALDSRQQPDASITRAWQRFLDLEDAVADAEYAGAVPTTSDFPAWLLLHEQALAQLLPLDLAKGTSAGEENYRCVHRWIHARQEARADDEMKERRALQASQPLLFRYLKERAAATGAATRSLL